MPVVRLRATSKKLEGGLDSETLSRELERLKKDMQILKQTQEYATKVIVPASDGGSEKRLQIMEDDLSRMRRFVSTIESVRLDRLERQCEELSDSVRIATANCSTWAENIRELLAVESDEISNLKQVAGGAATPRYRSLTQEMRDLEQRLGDEHKNAETVEKVHDERLDCVEMLILELCHTLKMKDACPRIQDLQLQLEESPLHRDRSRERQKVSFESPREQCQHELQHARDVLHELQHELQQERDELHELEQVSIEG